jgi:ribosomal protein S18 acetylase RimI-like enzyme
MSELHISNLRTVPHFAETLADRAWNAWWTDKIPLSEYRSWVDACLVGDGVPMALVAHDGDRYLGSVKLIASDLDSRPQYTPWIAALWVDPEYRRQGTATRLINAAASSAQQAGFTSVYLCANTANTPFYLARNFRQIEADVEQLNIFVFQN